MEDSFANRMDNVISVQFSDENCKTEPMNCTGSGIVSNTGLDDSALGITNDEHNDISTTCAFNGTCADSCQQSASFEELTKGDKIYTENHVELRLHADPILSKYCFIPVRENVSVSVCSKKVTINENCNKIVASNFNPSESFIDNENRTSGKMKLPIIKKKIAPVQSSDNKALKSISSPGLINLKRYPPISVRKMSRDSSTCNKIDKNTVRLKSDATFNNMSSHHSAQCIKQGQVKCDFVCSLYKSNNWSKSSTPKFAEMPKYEGGKKKSSRVTVKQISGSSVNKDKFTVSVTKDDDVDQCVCSFCEKKFGWEGMTCLKLDLPLPSSFMNPITLLLHYGINFSVPVCGSKENKNSALVNVCQICHDLVLDGDAAYQKLHHVTNQMRQLWPKLAVCKKTVPLVSDLLNGNFRACSSELDVATQSRKRVRATKGKRVIQGKRLPYILPKTSSIDPGSSMDVGVPPEIELGTTAKLDIESGKSKKIRSKPLTCGLCGTDFYVEDQWEHHLETFHRVQQKWQRFTPNMHSKLRTLVINELTKTDAYKDSKSPKGSKNVTHMCCACENTFNEKSVFVMHLRNYHNMTVDDKLISEFECQSLEKDNSSKKEEKESLPNQSCIIQDVDEILENCYSKVSMHYGTSRSKLKSPNGEEGNVNEILHIDNYENNSLATGDTLLNNTYCQNIGGGHSSKDDPSENLDINKINEQTTENPNCDDSRNITCLICGKKFKFKKGLENHLETAHLLSVVLKGDGSGGVLDYIVDNQDGDKSLKKEEEANLVSDETVNRATEYSDWQNDNVLNNPFLSENKQTVCKDVEKPGLPQCLVYECEICGRRITGKKLLHNHLKRIHNISMNLQDDDPLHYCKYCLFRSTSRTVLEEHRKNKHGKSKGMSQQQCETCGKIYSSAYIQEHVAVMHGNERKHTCEFCGMKFFDKKGVKSHIYFEHANKQWKCEKCNLTFQKYHQLRQHTIYVHSTKEFKCEKCSKVFKRKGDLTEHNKRLHEKFVMVCNRCSRQYRNTHKFRNHLINVHGLSKEETYSSRYARHKRANNRLQGQSEKVSDVPSDKVLGIAEDSEVQDTRIEIEKGEPEFHLVEVMETTNNDLEMDEVTVLILS